MFLTSSPGGAAHSKLEFAVLNRNKRTDRLGWRGPIPVRYLCDLRQACNHAMPLFPHIKDDGKVEPVSCVSVEVSFLSCDSMSEAVSLRGGMAYFGSRFQTWAAHYFGPRQHVVEQTCSHRGGQEVSVSPSTPYRAHPPSDLFPPARLRL